MAELQFIKFEFSARKGDFENIMKKRRSWFDQFHFERLLIL